MLIVVNWQIATPMYVKSKNFVNTHFMGNDLPQLTYYIGHFLNGCFETVKITSKKCSKSWNSGTSKIHFIVLLKNKSSKYLLQLNLKELMAYVSGEILKNFFRLHFDKKLLTDKWNLCWPVMHTTGKRIIQKGKMLIVVNWQIATPMYVKSKNFVNAHFMGNGLSQLTYYIGPFLNGCFETVKITKTKKCWKSWIRRASQI